MTLIKLKNHLKQTKTPKSENKQLTNNALCWVLRRHAEHGYASTKVCTVGIISFSVT